jgi:SRSO17 transposase
MRSALPESLFVRLWLVVGRAQLLIECECVLRPSSGVIYRHFTALVKDPRHLLRSCCEELGLGYVVAVKSDAQLFHNGQRGRISDHVVEFTKRQWQRLSCGKGTKGERFYDWASLSWPGSPESPFIHGLLVRRSISDPTDLAYFFTSAPRGTELQQLVLIAGRRWAIEECFEQAKQLTGLDEYEVRSWVGWYRHITLSMLAHAALAVMRAQSSRTTVLKKVPGG